MLPKDAEPATVHSVTLENRDNPVTVTDLEGLLTYGCSGPPSITKPAVAAEKIAP